MKVTLVSPPTTAVDRYPKGHPLRKATQVTEPLGLAYLASMVQDIADVKIVDCIAEDLSLRDCASRLADSDVVGISAVTSNIRVAQEIASAVWLLNPNARIVMGGIHPSLYPRETLENPAVDVVVVGEGERAFREIVSGGPLEKVRGIAFKKDGRIVETEPRPLEKDLDAFPFPARDLLPMGKYHPFLYLKKPVNALISSRGCPFTCIYCCRDISGQTYRVRKVGKVVEEIKFLKEEYGSREVDFQDPLFGLNEGWLERFCNTVIEERIDVSWSALTRVNVVNGPLLRLMKRAGCWMLYYGIEAGSQKLLDTVKKRTTLGIIRKSVELTNRAGIKSWGSFMFALPGETPELAKETLDYAKSLGLDFASFHLTTPFKGTELERNHKKWGAMSDDTAEYTQLNPVFIPFGWEGRVEELKKFYTDAFRSFYLRPSYILQEASRIRSINELWMFVSRLGAAA